MYTENLYGNFYLPVCALVYISLLAYVFFSRKKLKTIDNEMYARLISFNFIGDVLLIICIYFLIYDPSNILLEICKILYLIIIICAVINCNIYLINLSYTDCPTEERKKIHEKNSKLGLIIIIISSVILFIIPSYFKLNDKMLFESGGPGLMFDYGLCTLMELYWVAIFFRRAKNISFYKKMAILAVVIVVSIVSIIEFLVSANILIIDIGDALGIYILYLIVFLVDNPDMKMVEEIKNARVEAESSNESISEFLSYISMEMRKPLSTVVGFSEALKQEEVDDESKEVINDIADVSYDLLNIVNGISNASQMGSSEIDSLVNKNPDEENKEKESI